MSPEQSWDMYCEEGPTSTDEVRDEEKKSVRTEEEENHSIYGTHNTDSNSNLVDIPDYDDDQKWISWRKLWLFTGPGFLMSIAYLDPGNIESDLQSGAIAHFKLIWVLLLAHVLGLALQRLSARLGVVTGKDMAQVAHEYYPRIPRIALWIMVEIAIIGSDMQEVIGTATSLYLLTNGFIPLWVGVLLTILDTFSFMFLENYGIRKFEAFFCFLIAIMAGTFGYEFIIAAPDAGGLFKGMFFPWCDNCHTAELIQGISVVGAVIMPHNLYLHSALVKSRKIDRTKKNRVAEANKYYFIESAIALLCSFVINVLVVSVFAQSIYGKTNDQVYATCHNGKNGMPSFYMDVFPNNGDVAESDIYHAGVFLGCTFGVAALYVFAVGILAAGQSSTMTGTYAGQFAMEGFIQISLPKWKRILITRTLAIGPTLVVTIFSQGIEHLSGLNDLLNCIMMLQLPFALIPIITFVSDRKIMGDFLAGLPLKVFTVIVSFVVVGINIFFVYDYVNDNFGFSSVSIPIVVIGAIFYLLFIAYLFIYAFIGVGIYRPSESSRFVPLPKYSAFTHAWDAVSLNEKTQC